MATTVLPVDLAIGLSLSDQVIDDHELALYWYLQPSKVFATQG